MPIIFEGTTVEKVVFGGTEVDKVVFNGVTVFESKPQLATPQNVTADGTNVSWDEVENATSYEVIEGGNNVLGTVSATKLINFKIRDESYQAEEGMTWAQWVASSYNTANPAFSLSKYTLSQTYNNVYRFTGAETWVTYSGGSSTMVVETDKIQANHTYPLYIGSGQ